MIRTGLNSSGRPDEWRSKVEVEIKAVHTAEAKAPSLSFLYDLRLFTLDAEYLDLCGRHEEAQSRLSSRVQPREGADILNWFPRASKRARVKDEKTRKKELRQMCWALLMYAWVAHYRRGDAKGAISVLEKVRVVIEEQLIGKAGAEGKWPSYGTLSRWHYFYAHALRIQRDFANADIHFERSQFYAKRRLESRFEKLQIQIEQTQDELWAGELQAQLEYERRFGTICTARILGSGQGWSSLQQGRLSRSVQMLSAADTLLASTGHEPIKASVKMLLAMAERRRCPLKAVASYEKILQRLGSTAVEFNKLGDTRSEIRCFQEVARGYLDLATREGSPSDSRDSHISAAEQWAEKMTEPARKIKDFRWCVRAELLRSRAALFAENISRAQELHTQAASMAEKHKVTSCEEELRLVGALIALDSSDFNRCRSLCRKVKRSAKDDPVVEAECELLLAECAYREGLGLDLVTVHLAKWRHLEMVVENQYLHTFAQSLIARSHGVSFQIRHSDPLNWGEINERIRVWMIRTAATRIRETGKVTYAEIARALGVDRATIKRACDEREELKALIDGERRKVQPGSSHSRFRSTDVPSTH